MPELPEVESVRKVLKNSLLNQKLISYKITEKRINRFNNTKPKSNGLLSEIKRKGKVLQFKFENISFLFHLGMSGRLSLNSSKNKHTHGVFNFENDILLFDDIRKFGYIKILHNDDVENHFEKHGLDTIASRFDPHSNKMMNLFKHYPKFTADVIRKQNEDKYNRYYDDFNN